MEDPVAAALLKQYFRRLEQALNDLPADRRTQIIEDLRADVEERLEGESEPTEATVLAILDRLGDPDEIAQEALADHAAIRASADAAGHSEIWATELPDTDATKRRLQLAAPVLVVLAVAAIVIVGLTGALSSASAKKPSATDPSIHVLAAGITHHVDANTSPEDVDSSCTPSFTNESATTLESGATEVASGTSGTQSWTLWSKQGETGATGLEDGGLVIGSEAYGLCPGYPNPAELELLEPSGGGNGIVYGVVGYPGSATVDVYRGTAGTFQRGALLDRPTVQVVNGVAFFIGVLPQSACSYPSLELDSTSSQDSSEHNLGFGTCTAGQQVAFTTSQGIWQQAPGHFPATFGVAGGGGGAGAGGAGSGDSGALQNGWLPATDVSGDHQSPGASDCTPQTTSGSESASTLEAGATQVASGSVDGHTWSLWSKNGQSGANGLETGGVVVDGTAYGLCPGFPNPAEMEMLEPSGGGDGIAYGVVGYRGTAKVAIYADTFGNFATGTLLAKTTAQQANGVGFFITSLSESACDVGGIEINTASSNDATEHNLAFSTSDCTDGQLVPISDSQGIWGLSTADFPDKFQSAGGGGGGGSAAPALQNGWLPASAVSGGGGVDTSTCSPQTLSGSESASTLESGATQVGSGTIGGQSWSVWSKNGESGATGLEDGGVVVNGVAYGMCPGFPNPSETELLEPSGGGDGIAYGVIGYPGASKVAIYQGTAETFDTGTQLASITSQTANGVGFYITQLSQSACDISSLEINVAAATYASEHNLGFTDSDCTDGQLVPISWSQGVWQLPTSDFPNSFQNGGGGSGAGGMARLTTVPGYDSRKESGTLLKQYRILTTNRVSRASLPLMVEHLVSHTGPMFGLDTSDVAEVHEAGVTMWFIPGTSGDCALETTADGGGGSCNKIDSSRGPGSTSYSPRGGTAEGFVPNSVRSIIVSLANGKKLTVPVKDNAYYIRVTGTQIRNISLSSH